MDKLENIGFYTLSDYRASQVSKTSPMWRCEMILTEHCNFKCPYCRGLDTLSRDCSGNIHSDIAFETLKVWCQEGLKNVRFSGGEPTFHPQLPEFVDFCKEQNVERIAISSNGSRNFSIYQDLLNRGVNDFSISLDACCSSTGDIMSGVKDSWEIVIENIRRLSQQTYVTVGIVLTSQNVHDLNNTIVFAHDLGVDDIRVISSAQYNELLNIDIIQLPLPQGERIVPNRKVETYG